jgi:hypothetical protein
MAVARPLPHCNKILLATHNFNPFEEECAFVAPFHGSVPNARFPVRKPCVFLVRPLQIDAPMIFLYLDVAD